MRAVAMEFGYERLRLRECGAACQPTSAWVQMGSDTPDLARISRHPTDGCPGTLFWRISSRPNDGCLEAPLRGGAILPQHLAPPSWRLIASCRASAAIRAAAAGGGGLGPGDDAAAALSGTAEAPAAPHSRRRRASGQGLCRRAVRGRRW